MGHELLQSSLPLELQEAAQVYALTHGEKLTASALGTALNELPDRCFRLSTARGSAGPVQIHVIGWGQWALFLQRHMCHAVQQNFRFMYRSWGVPDEAKQFATQCDKQFGELRLYPFVRRYNCTEAASYHSAVDDGFKVVRATPHLVPAHCWDFLCAPVRAVPVYRPYTNPHITEWRRHDPPPGTAYDLATRLSHGNLTGRPDFLERLEALHALAPSHLGVLAAIVKRKYKDRPTYAQAMELYRPLLPYSVTALRAVASTLHDKPVEYEKVLREAAALDPDCYYDLGNYYVDLGKEDKAAAFFEQACTADPDAVRVSNYSLWRVRYYLHKGDTAKAGSIADEAAEVYSSVGLQAKAVFLEHLKKYDEAFEWFAKIEERYRQSDHLIDFCLRYAELTGSKRFEPELQKRLAKLFPNGLEKVAVKDFQAPPTDGVRLEEENQLLRSAGLKKGDVIVAVYGTRVHNVRQYTFGRNMRSTPELELIVWQRDGYRELRPKPPQHRFGVPVADYQPGIASAQ